VLQNEFKFFNQEKPFPVGFSDLKIQLALMFFLLEINNLLIL
jgi:hypothetical protein